MLGPEASVLKIRGSEIQQRITELTLKAVGYYGLAYSKSDNEDRFNSNRSRPDYSVNVASNYLNMREKLLFTVVLMKFRKIFYLKWY